MRNKVLFYIEKNWDKCIVENKEDKILSENPDDVLMGLPHVYSIPAVGRFNCLYYWDTFFTNIGLELCGRMHIAKANTDNMLYLVEKYGYMPNGSKLYYLGQSQPPYLSLAIRRIYDYYKDKIWLADAYETLNKEYIFWMEKRISPTGLNSYGSHKGDNFDYDGVTRDYEHRIKSTVKGDRKEIALHCLASCESGWDMNPKWGTQTHNYNHVDLNCLLYIFEKNMEFFSSELNKNEENLWQERAEKRLGLMNKYLYSDKLFKDYNYKNYKHCDLASVSSFMPLFAGIAEKEKAEEMKNILLEKLEAKYGILTCEKNDFSETYQWNYPNGWACLQYITVMALDRYGFKEDSLRIAEKYVNLIEKTFADTGKLWEKYNVLKGNTKVCQENDAEQMPEMMGWSAGTYLFLINYIEKNKN